MTNENFKILETGNELTSNFFLWNESSFLVLQTFSSKISKEVSLKFSRIFLRYLFYYLTLQTRQSVQLTLYERLLGDDGIYWMSRGLWYG